MFLRALTLMVTVLFGAQAVGLAEALSRACEERCDDDDSNGHCPPTCGSCTCAPRMSEPARVLVVLAPPAPLVIEDGAKPLERAACFAPEGFRADIQHVPIAG